MTEGVSTPPIFAGELAAPPRRVVWPIVLGVISIVLGALACLYALVAMAMMMMLPAMTGWTSYTPTSTTQVDPGALMRDHAWLLVLAYGQLGVGAALLLIAGIGVVKRRAWGASLMRAWGVVGILVALGMGASIGMFEARVMGAAFVSVGSSAGTRGGPPPEVGYVAGVVIGVLTAIVLAIFPMFILIWFMLRGVRAEVGRWRKGAAA